MVRLCLIVLLLCSASQVYGQVELLPVDHPATLTLIRLYDYGSIQEFPKEHLPITRGLALKLLRKAEQDSTLPMLLRQQASYYRVELSADNGDVKTSVFIPHSDSSVSIYRSPFAGNPVAILWHRDTSLGARVTFEPVLSAELRTDLNGSETVLIAQGGAELRASILNNHIGIGARITNGTIAGDSLLALRDPSIARTGKYAISGFGKDIDFGYGFLRADFDAAFAEIDREKIQLGGGGSESLLMGSALPSDYDCLRIGIRFPNVSFTHVHASVISDPMKGPIAGPDAKIPPKFIAAHLLSLGPFYGIRLSIGEAVVYTGRPLELGYLNPFNFMKSQEHYLRNRDNALMYLAMSALITNGLKLEGEFMLDDLKFSLIGKHFWGNKAASRIGVTYTGLLGGMLDLRVHYTRLEPFTFSHFDTLNAYTHDATNLAAGGMEPNSEQFAAGFTLTPLPNFWISFSGSFINHGRNIIDSTGKLIRNVGGDIQRTIDSTTPAEVVFLDGTLETSSKLKLSVEWEVIRNVYLYCTAFSSASEVLGTRKSDSELWIGARVGAH